MGGRQAESSSPAGGGGYLGTCTVSKIDGSAFASDPRLGELREMGITAVHLRVAEAIGFDAFMTMWRIYDRDPSCRNALGDLRILMRSYRSYLRYQRNRVVEALHAEGLSDREIRARLEKEMGERLSLRHIFRIVSKR